VILVVKAVLPRNPASESVLNDVATQPPCENFGSIKVLVRCLELLTPCSPHRYITFPPSENFIGVEQRNFFGTSDGRTFGCVPKRILKFSIPYGGIGFTIENFTTANLHA